MAGELDGVIRREEPGPADLDFTFKELYAIASRKWDGSRCCTISERRCGVRPHWSRLGSQLGGELDD